ncbi:MAG TPA: conjugative transposon protein TraM [Mucilaginibacter sp.]
MTTSEKRKLTMLLVMPLFVLLFSALGFYALGGGRTVGTEQSAANQGINTTLPGAKLGKNAPPDKMGLYDQAQRNSAAARSHSAAGAFAALGWDTASMHKQAGTNPNSAAASEARIKEKLAEINRQISQPQPAKPPADAAQPDPQTAELVRLEALIRQKQQTAGPDPQMQQLNSMLDKIQQIQNPGLVREKLKKDEAAKKPDSAFKAIPALIDGNQKIAPGGVVRLKLADSVTIAGIHYAKGQALSGACNVTNQRLLLDIRTVRLGTSIIPVNFTVFSLDGLAGIPAPEAELSEAAGGGTADALESMQFLSADYSLGTQAATAGISAAKGLLGKKARRIRVKLHGGQPILLRVNKS